MITYLASPYSHEDPIVKQIRFNRVVEEAAYLMKQGEVIFCPIAHSHPIDSKMLKPESWEFWKKQDGAILNHCTKLKVLMLGGWEESVGVTWEINRAKQLGIPVEYIDADQAL